MRIPGIRGTRAPLLVVGIFSPCGQNPRGRGQINEKSQGGSSEALSDKIRVEFEELCVVGKMSLKSVEAKFPSLRSRTCGSGEPLEVTLRCGSNQPLFTGIRVELKELYDFLVFEAQGRCCQKNVAAVKTRGEGNPHVPNFNAIPASYFLLKSERN